MNKMHAEALDASTAFSGTGDYIVERSKGKGRSRFLTPPDQDNSTRSRGAKPTASEAENTQDGDGQTVLRDIAARSKDKPSMLEFLRHAQEKSGRQPIEIAREFLRLNRGRGKLTWPEYVQYGVYDVSRHSREDQSRFLTNTLHWAIAKICCDMSWQAATEDKWLCSHLLGQTKVKVPETLAVIDKTARSFPGSRKISTTEDLRDFMKSQDVLPVFGKENRGICSYGAFLVLDADESGLLLKGEGEIAYDTFMDQFVGATPYLIQRLEKNHDFFDAYTDALATVRVCILVRETGIKIPFAVLKMPSKDNLADSFWRPGNLACDLDPKDGKVLTLRSKDALGTTDHMEHPETGQPILGKVLPMWDRLLDMVNDCAPMFWPLPYQSMDIAITPDGPVLIEVNTGGGFDLPQLASGRGFLTDEVCDFFRSCGYKKI
jgi:hypothetical protein